MLRIEFEARERGLTQTAIAKATGINRVIVNRLMRGLETPWPKWREAIAEALGWEGDPLALFEPVEPSGEATNARPVPWPAQWRQHRETEGGR